MEIKVAARPARSIPSLSLSGDEGAVLGSRDDLLPDYRDSTETAITQIGQQRAESPSMARSVIAMSSWSSSAKGNDDHRVRLSRILV